MLPRVEHPGASLRTTEPFFMAHALRIAHQAGCVIRLVAVAADLCGWRTGWTNLDAVSPEAWGGAPNGLVPRERGGRTILRGGERLALALTSYEAPA
jgi:hypothetical protein